jgi:hypothetical protein
MEEDYDFSQSKRGAIDPVPGKTRIIIQLNDEFQPGFVS